MQIVRFASSRTNDLVSMSRKEREWLAYVLRYYAGECEDKAERTRAKRHANTLEDKDG